MPWKEETTMSMIYTQEGGTKACAERPSEVWEVEVGDGGDKDTSQI
jgi:hypothetical protein